MEKIANDTLSIWKEEGSCLIQDNFNVFSSLVNQARDYIQCSKYEAAAVYAEIAAVYATVKHCGLFVSSELEQVLLTIGRNAIVSSFYPANNTSLPETKRNILHVSTSVMSIGGHSRMLWRWIQQDTERSHSLVLTRQGSNNVPNLLKDAIKNSGGKIYVLNEKTVNIFSRATRLREIAATADLVVLHIFGDDIIPTIAFANKEQFPPIIFLDHADHLFWLGAAISDVVVNLRKSGMNLSQQRRGIEAERNVLLPIPLEPTHRVFSRADAKRQLGISENTVLLLSIARAAKYRIINGINFADLHVPLLKSYDQAILIVIGPGNHQDWSAAIQKTEGRIKLLPEREDTAIFYQAADIYVDSFPFVSITSLLEAGSYGLPLISRYPFSDSSAILGADTPGLVDNFIRVKDTEEYIAVLSQLIENEEFRLSLGEAIRQKIADNHTGLGWRQFLEAVYIRAFSMSKINLISAPSGDNICLDEPDVFLPLIHGANLDLEQQIRERLPIISFSERLHIWLQLVKKYGFRGQISALLPEFYFRLYLRLRSFLLYSVKAFQNSRKLS